MPVFVFKIEKLNSIFYGDYRDIVGILCNIDCAKVPFFKKKKEKLCLDVYIIFLACLCQYKRVLCS